MPTSSEILTKRLNDLLLERDWSPNRLATMSGVSQSTISTIMNNKTASPRFDVVEKLARGLGMSLTEFLDFPPYNQRPDGSSAAKQRSKWEELGNALTPEERERVRRILLNGKE